MKQLIFIGIAFLGLFTHKASAQIYDSLDAQYPFALPTETCVGDNPCSADNQIYTAGSEFVFTYYWLKDKKAQKVVLTPGMGAKIGDSQTYQYNWEWMPSEKMTGAEKYTVQKLLMSIPEKKGGLMIGQKDQTIIENRYMQYDQLIPDMPADYESEIKGEWMYPFEITGLIECSQGVWMRPHREFGFKISQLNPYPYIQFPIQKGNKWRWKYTVSDYWSDPHWKSWNDVLTVYCDYEITGQVELPTTKLGKLKCYIVEATGQSDVGVTKMKAFFNSKYGFVKIVYTNIDESELSIDLETVKK
ncbi:MAG: hypothetical protein ACKVTZ_00780 [Bacteroidia bacterium]